MWRSLLWAIMGLVVEGCASSVGHLPNRIAQERARLRVPTYQVLEKGLGADPDGYTFHSERFRFEFSKEFDQVEGYRTPQERLERGKIAYAVLEGGYAFVRDLFGVEVKRPIRVVISPTLNGKADEANTFVQWDTLDGLRVEGSEQATMNFGQAAFESKATLAHELSHALLSKYGLPTWMDEGIATLVEHDYANGVPWVSEHTTLTLIGFDENGYNILQTWRSDGNPLPFRSAKAYGAAYAIVKEMQRRYGTHIFVRLFRELDRTRIPLRPNRLTTRELVDTLNRITGQQTEQFFQELHFRTDDGQEEVRQK